MMISEFIDRTGFTPTYEEYQEIEEAYYNFDGNKDAFCKAFVDGALLERANISYPPLQIVPIGSPLRGSQWERGMERNKLTCSRDRRRPGPCRPRCRCTSRSSW